MKLDNNMGLENADWSQTSELWGLNNKVQPKIRSSLSIRIANNLNSSFIIPTKIFRYWESIDSVRDTDENM